MILKTLFYISLITLQTSLLAQENWTLQLSSPLGLYSIKAVDTSVVWVCGDSGTVFRTTDGGANWKLTNSPNDSLNCYNIEAINADTAWVVTVGPDSGGRTVLYNTTNGGLSWTAQKSSSLPGSFYNAVRFYDSNNGIFYGDPEDNYFAIYTTDNGGKTWIRTDSSKISKPLEGEYGEANVMAIWGNSAWFGTQVGLTGVGARIFYSNDRGKNWTAVTVNDSQSVIESIAFSSELNGILLSDRNFVGHTSNGGLNWTLTNLNLSESALCFATSSSAFITGIRDFVSRDGGATWNPYDYSDFETVSFADSTTGWGGYYNKIFKWNGGPITSSEEKVRNDIPSNFELEQNYPNPFNPTTKIEYSIPKTSFVILKVYDVLGREVTTLVSEEKPEGVYNVDFNGSGLSSGIYFYKIQVDSYYSVKKMILIK